MDVHGWIIVLVKLLIQPCPGLWAWAVLQCEANPSPSSSSVELIYLRSDSNGFLLLAIKRLITFTAWSTYTSMQEFQVTLGISVIVRPHVSQWTIGIMSCSRGRMDLPGFKEPFAALHFIPRSLLIILVKVIAENLSTSCPILCRGVLNHYVQPNFYAVFSINSE